MAETLINTLATFTFLSKNLEKSETQVLAKIDKRFSFVKEESYDEERRMGRRKEYISEIKLQLIVTTLEKFANYLKLTETQTAVFIATYTVQLEDGFRSGIDAISRFFNMDSIDALPIKKEYEYLKEKGYLRTTSVARGRRNTQIQIDSDLEQAIINNKPFKLSPITEIDRYQFCLLVSNEINKRSEGDCSTSDLFHTVSLLEEKHKNLKFIKTITRKLKDIEDRTLFYEICDDYVCYGETGIDCTLSDIYESTSKKFKVAAMIMSDNHKLIKNKWIERKPASFFSRASVALTQEGQELFLEKDNKVIQSTKNNDKRLISPENIDEKQLFFSDELQEQINFLGKSLENNRFIELQKKLKDKSMPQGICAIFYGTPGTGKTETAMQLAKATGRKVMHVDISATKTCWYGESEKLVKKIFTDYATICKNEKQKPILLFNEADALFGKRREDIHGSVDQTDNAIQNILLEEMEKLNGIMIATTNLADNLDDAFERRFLFKIKFNKPTTEAKRNIWKSKLPNLSDNACEKLASKFDFSGGEIDNIARKFTMKEILEDCVPTYESIENICLNERLNKKSRKVVGF
ncbi:MAG: ATP-binding protein [Bacteroidales bacterium]|nr:ATP-binding protein [Bacteroidales bacterium]